MIGAPNTQSQKCFVGGIQLVPAIPVLEEIADIYHNYI